jgi:3-hydroxyisobutyrate dehydrogenase-like beta-hydroxyacid dehydrogenase
MCMSNDTFDGSLGLLGFGEVGQRFAADLRDRDPRRRLATFDLLLHQAVAGKAMRRHAEANAVEMLTDAAGLVGPQALVFSAVTADQTLAAARSLCARALDGAWIVDLNSAAPQVKAECAALVAAAGGRYVEAAVMGAVAPHGIRVPMLLGGPNAAAAEQRLHALGFAVEAVSADIGVASAIKLCRSVVIKGLEALLVESFTAARHFGVERQVLTSLAATFPQIDWEKQGDYQFSRVIQHGRRRAEEMRASAQMIDEAGIGGVMAAAAARRQQAVAEVRAAGGFTDPDAVRPWRERADEIVAKRPTEPIRPAGKRVSA